MSNMKRIRSSASNQRNGRWLLLAPCWALVVVVFASQWFFYDSAHGLSDRFLFYLGWSFYLWGVLTPLALWLGRRYPIEAGTWALRLPLHIAFSMFLTIAQLSLEASLSWLRAGADWSLSATLGHYLRQHTQIGFLIYWLLVGAAQFYRMYDQSRQRQVHAAQLEARLAEAMINNLRTQLHPHFLFNTLQAVATLIPEDPEAAEDVVQQLSQLLRVSLDQMHADEISLSRELEFLQHYMAIQQRRFGDRLCFEVQISSALLDCAVPTLVLQPLVENAIRYGISKHKEHDVVTIRAFERHDRICLEVINLSSQLEEKPERLLSRGVGLSNTRLRLEQLYGIEQSLSLFQLEPKGVCVRLSIPIRRFHPEENTASAMATA
ncbi:MAG: histidine kinase [Acidobacteria bacterium]|nr:histidine kinase [Acidobacteriota bacterium]